MIKDVTSGVEVSKPPAGKGMSSCGEEVGSLGFFTAVMPGRRMRGTCVADEGIAMDRLALSGWRLEDDTWGLSGHRKAQSKAKAM